MTLIQNFLQKFVGRSMTECGFGSGGESCHPASLLSFGLPQSGVETPVGRLHAMAIQPEAHEDNLSLDGPESGQGFGHTFRRYCTP